MFCRGIVAPASGPANVPEPAGGWNGFGTCWVAGLSVPFEAMYCARQASSVAWSMFCSDWIGNERFSRSLPFEAL